MLAGNNLAPFLLMAVTLAAAAVGAWRLIERFRSNPEARETKRRLRINELGRLTDGYVTDVQEDLLFYTYALAGVEYTTSQDISRLGEQLKKSDSQPFIGPVTIKYLPRNPANSIVVCEQWSGFRQYRPLTITNKGA
jgi:hypothetical protein